MNSDMPFNLFPPHVIDFYKTAHLSMYPPGTEYVYLNFTPRADHLANVLPDFDHKVVFMGLTAALREIVQMWKDQFFLQPKDKVIARFKARMDSSIGPGMVPTKPMEDLHDLGYLPLKIKALPEGARVNVRVPVYTVVNTDPRFFWLGGYMETMLSAETWKCTTSATTAYEYRRLLDEFCETTGGEPYFVPWQGHDFSARGMSGNHDAAHSGMGHLTSFLGTDTVSAIDKVEHFYGDGSLIGASIPATEHSIMCMGLGAGETEPQTWRRIMNEVIPTGPLSIVADTVDFFELVTTIAEELKPDILARDGKVVFRPDSGDPVKIICGNDAAAEDSPEYLGALQCLWNVFGGTVNAKGYRVLNQKVGLIYGDSITVERASVILHLMEEAGFASTNIVFGIGSFTYNYVTRDTFGHALKATWGIINGKAVEISKTPKTDGGAKHSARGLLRVEKEGDNYVLYDRQSFLQECAGELIVVFWDGGFFYDPRIGQIRHQLHGKADLMKA